MANKGQRMIFEDEYQYLKDLKENHSDPSAEWGGGGGDVIDAGTGITITTESDDTKTISVDTSTVALKTDIPTNYVTTDTAQEITGEKTIVRKYSPSQLAEYRYKFAPPKSSIYSGIWEFIVPNRLYNSNNLYYAAANSEGIVDIKDLVPSKTSDLNNDSGFITSSDLPTNYVTTDTAQTITGVKTISGTGDILNLKASSTNSTGIQFLNSSNGQIGNVYATRQDFDFTNSPLTMAVGLNSSTSTGDTSGKDRHLGFKYASNNNGTMYYCNAMVPTRYTTSNTVADKCAYIPLAFTDGTNTVKSDNTGSVNISTLLPNKVSGTNDGTNWTALTIGSDTYNIPQGGGGSSYTFTNGLTESSGTVSVDSTVVRTSGTQTIAGSKTFSDTITTSGNVTAKANINFATSIGGSLGTIKADTTTDRTGLILQTTSTSNGYITIKPKYVSRFKITDDNGTASITLPTGLSGNYKFSVTDSNNELLNITSITDGTNTVSVADLAALITYAKSQGWIS